MENKRILFDQKVSARQPTTSCPWFSLRWSPIFWYHPWHLWNTYNLAKMATNTWLGPNTRRTWNDVISWGTAQGTGRVEIYVSLLVASWALTYPFWNRWGIIVSQAFFTLFFHSLVTIFGSPTPQRRWKIKPWLVGLSIQGPLGVLLLHVGHYFSFSSVTINRECTPDQAYVADV